jgi:hypothetical protein
MSEYCTFDGESFQPNPKKNASSRASSAMLSPPLRTARARAKANSWTTGRAHHHQYHHLRTSRLRYDVFGLSRRQRHPVDRVFGAAFIRQPLCARFLPLSHTHHTLHADPTPPSLVVLSCILRSRSHVTSFLMNTCTIPCNRHISK